MTRRKRILIELLAPPPLGALLLLAPWLIQSAYAQGFGSPLELLSALVGLVPFATFISYLFAGIPSIIFTVLMECGFFLGLNPASWRVLGYSTILGGFMGYSLPLIASEAHQDSIGIDEARLGVTGLMVGFIVGLMIKIASANKQKRCQTESNAAASFDIRSGPPPPPS